MLTGKVPFLAHVPLTSIRQITVGRPFMGLIGSSLTFDLASGEELRFDVQLASDSAQRVVGAVRDAMRSASWEAASPRVAGIEVTSRRPPIRTPPVRAVLVTLAFWPPWMAAMLGIRNGPFAAAALTGGLFVALVLGLFRPRLMAVILACAMGIGGAAFAIDAVRLGQPVRLLGTASCGLIALCMVLFGRPRKVRQT
ncbi:MAG TPA: hypothetical protein VHT30_08665 [Acidimicrobiales bacterium]|nr:hypothetical protein [Acidimicrobiales bacterium]